MEIQEIKVATDRFIGALHALEQADNETGPEAGSLAALFAEESEIRNAAFRLTEEACRGREGVRLFWQEYKETVGKCRSEFHAVTFGENAAGLFWTTEGTAPGKPETFRYDGATLLTFAENGMILLLDGHYDTEQLNRTLGRERE